MKFHTKKVILSAVVAGLMVPITVNATNGAWLIGYGAHSRSMGGTGVAGGKMKRTGTYFWNSPNTGANNSSGFTAIPGGSRNRESWFDSMGEFGCFWTSSEQGEYYAWFLSLRNSSESAGSILGINGLDWCDKNYGDSVRCIKDY